MLIVAWSFSGLALAATRAAAAAKSAALAKRGRRGAVALAAGETTAPESEVGDMGKGVVTEFFILRKKRWLKGGWDRVRRLPQE
jgi:hypothetical protein